MKEVTTRFKEDLRTWSWQKGSAAAKKRSNGRCEAGTEVCTGKAAHVHHRLMRSQGGGHEPSLLLAVCLPCHGHIHANPAKSYEAGWLIRSGAA